MRLAEYHEKIRLYRGHLKSVSGELNDIWRQGCDELIDFSLRYKKMGIRRMADVAGMPHDKQKEFLVWVQEKPRNKIDIDIKLLEML